MGFGSNAGSFSKTFSVVFGFAPCRLASGISLGSEWWLGLYLTLKLLLCIWGTHLCAEAWRSLGQLWVHAQNVGTLLTAHLSQGFLHTLGLSTHFVRSYVQNVRLLFELFPLALFRFGYLRVLSGKSGERKKKGKKNNEHFPQSLQTTGIPFPVFSAQRNGFSLWISDGRPSMHGPWGSAPLGWTLAWRLGPERRERKMGNPTACAVSWHLDAEMPRRFG